MANTALKQHNFYPGSAEKYNGDLSFESNSLANNSFTIGQKQQQQPPLDFMPGQIPDTSNEYPLRQQGVYTGGGGFISIKNAK